MFYYNTFLATTQHYNSGTEGEFVCFVDIDLQVIVQKCAPTLNNGIFYREIFEFDNYSPIPVETEDEYKLVVSRFPFHDIETEKVKSLNNIASLKIFIAFYYF